MEGESRFGEGSEIKRAAPGGTCASLRDRREARAHGVEKGKWEREAGGGGRVARWSPAKRRSLQPSPAAPRLPAALRSRRDPPRSGFRRLGARRAQNVASDGTPAPHALALGAGAADPGRRGAVPRRPAAQAPREARLQEQVSARPRSQPRGWRGSFPEP